MIRYGLACAGEHEFETWFPSASQSDEQIARGLVECPVCGSTDVEKRLMAPAIGRKGAARKGPETEPSVPAESSGPAEASTASRSAEAPQPVALMGEREQAIRAMLRAVREHVTKTADYVGQGFAAEARKMHYGETPHRSIYGEANPVETKALIEEGIEIHPLPVVPDDRN